MLWNLHNELLFDPLGSLGEKPQPQAHMNSGTDGKDVGGGIEE